MEISSNSNEGLFLIYTVFYYCFYVSLLQCLYEQVGRVFTNGPGDKGSIPKKVWSGVVCVYLGLRLCSYKVWTGRPGCNTKDSKTGTSMLPFSAL